MLDFSAAAQIRRILAFHAVISGCFSYEFPAFFAQYVLSLRAGRNFLAAHAFDRKYNIQKLSK
jgi:hypothetical protein